MTTIFKDVFCLHCLNLFEFFVGIVRGKDCIAGDVAIYLATKDLYFLSVLLRQI